MQQSSFFKYISRQAYLIVLACIFCLGSVAQTTGINSLKGDLLKQKDDTNKVNTLSRIEHASYNQGNYSEALGFDLRLIDLCEKLGDKKGLAAGTGNIGLIDWSLGNYTKALEYDFKALAIAQQISDKQALARNYCNIGNVYWSMGNYASAIDYQLKALAIDNELGNKIALAGNLGNIGNIYFYQGNYTKALDYYSKALPIFEAAGDKNMLARILGNIGNTYSDKHDYAKALEYDNKVLLLVREIGNKNTLVISLGDIGKIYAEQGNYAKAMECYNEAIVVASIAKEKEELAYIYRSVGAIYTQQKNYKQAAVYLDSALVLSKAIGNNEDIMDTYGDMATLDSVSGKYINALSDFKHYLNYHDSLINIESANKVAQLELSYTFEQREDSVKAVQERAEIIHTSETNRKNIITGGAIIIAILAVLLAVIFTNRQQLKHKKDKLVLEKEKQHIEDELAGAKAILDEYLNSMDEKNKLLEQFKTDVEELKSLKSKEIDEARVERLESLNRVTILTEEDWSKFQKLFEQVHKGYFVRLKEKLPDLTQAEIRLVCLTKLKTDSKQMANILGVSPDTIRKSRYRLRKKLGLAEEDSISDIAESI